MLETLTDAHGHARQWNQVTRWMSRSGSPWVLVPLPRLPVLSPCPLTGYEEQWVFLQEATPPSGLLITWVSLPAMTFPTFHLCLSKPSQFVSQLYS